ncbi:sensor histidine kinase [Segetibacter sp. 3557_3]|uniref:sensor histidine kinase n=1 Tax=Segetibacter sp. 3557_3 TaxID=2547429 RepID=UPI001058A79E|nr:histidine kinase dimerization/phospho-acceptor domain-containing protein [Segetibacter sp. 3557_3]TDH21271.1 sensor histidine kinase [Segetibacter sp. 3557_3]
MRLLTKTTLYFLLAMVPLLAGAGFYLFYYFGKELDERDDLDLVNNELQWIRYLEDQTSPRTAFILRGPELLIHPIDDFPQRYPTIIDTIGYSLKANKRIPVRQLSHVVPINGVPYKLTIRKSQEQKSVLVSNLTRLMLLVFAALFLATLIFNFLISKSLWKPFRLSLEKIRGAELQKMEAIHFAETNIAEFNELNSSLNSMTRKIHNDYVNMKEFTENAAHEMQTPLAVAKSKLELLLQDPGLDDEQVQSIVQAESALNRLSKLNQSLLLLAKIENNQYETTETVSLAQTTNKYLKLFEEVIRDKDVRVETHLEDDFMLSLHPFLADSLVSNLIGNAVKYNYKGGNLIISSGNRHFRVSNTSLLPPIASEELFKRFKKSGGGDETSTGLGLAIVKKIIDAHGLSIRYHAESGLHHFTIEKP